MANNLIMYTRGLFCFNRWKEGPLQRVQEEDLQGCDDPSRRVRVEQGEPLLRLVRRGALGQGSQGGGGRWKVSNGHNNNNNKIKHKK